VELAITVDKQKINWEFVGQTAQELMKRCKLAHRQKIGEVVIIQEDDLIRCINNLKAGCAKRFEANGLPLDRDMSKQCNLQQLPNRQTYDKQKYRVQQPVSVHSFRGPN
jgi:hypothetical protein